MEFLLDPLVDIMILKDSMTYCMQETWVVENTVIMVRGHIIFLHNRCEMKDGTKGRNSGGVDIILALTVVVSWKEDGSNYPITTTFDSKFVGRFVGIKISFPKIYKWGKRVRDFMKLFVVLIYHPIDNK